MLQQLQAILSALTPPAAHSGEAFLLHQSLAVESFLVAKCNVYEKQCQSPDLKEWIGQFKKVLSKRAEDLSELLNKFQVPLPPSVPMTNELSDQLMALDCAAMIKGLISTDSIALQSIIRADLGLWYAQALSSNLTHGATLLPIMTKEGWAPHPPAYQGAVPKP